MYGGRAPRTTCIRYVNAYGRIKMIVGYPLDPLSTGSHGSMQNHRNHHAPRSPGPPTGHHPAGQHHHHSGPQLGPRIHTPVHRTTPRIVSRQDSGGRSVHRATSGVSRTTTTDTDDAEECVEKYQNHFSWLRDSKFLQDLENDSVDSDIIEEELSALQEEEVTISKRQKVVKFLQSNPVQILLCVVVLLDAVIVIAQILLDLNSVKIKLGRREEQLGRFLNIVRIKWPDELHGYGGRDFEHILQIMEDHLCDNTTDQKAHVPANKSTKHGNVNTTNMPSSIGNMASNNSTTRTRREGLQSHSAYTSDRSRDTSKTMTSDLNYSQEEEIALVDDSEQQRKLEEAHKAKTHDKQHMQLKGSKPNDDATHNTQLTTLDCSKLYHEHGSSDVTHMNHVEEEEHDVLHEVAHGLHFASIAMLGFLVLEDVVKIIAMGTDFFRHKMEIFDALIITSSFAFDIIFLGGVTGEEGQKAAAILVVLLLWRIARVVDGIMVTVKQRQEFRIRLQKRSRRNAERKIDLLEDERHCRVKQILALKELCQKAGVRDEEIDACTPRRPRRVSTTMCALSSVARLSVSMTMSMSSGLFSLVDEDGERVADDNAGKPGRLDHRRYSSNSGKTREYLGPCDAYECSPKTSKKRSAPPSPKPGFIHAADGIYLPKLPESSLETTTDAPEDAEVTSIQSQNDHKSSHSLSSTLSNHERKSSSGSIASKSSPKMKKKSPEKGKNKHKDKTENSKTAQKNKSDKVTPPLPLETDSRISSPENSSGVQIVIDEGSEVNSCCSQEGDETKPFKRDSYLTVDAAYDDDRRASATSQIYLLSEIR